MTITYRGQPIDHAIHNYKAETYSLIDPVGNCVAEIKAIEFLSFPNRNNLEVRSGRHRPTGSKDQRGAAGKSGQSGRDDAADALALTFKPGTITAALEGPGSSLTLTDLQRGYVQMKQLQSGWWNSPGILASMIYFAETMKPPPLKRDGVVAGEIVGYRCWRIQRGDPCALIGRLRSVYQTDVWNPGEVLEGRELGDWDSRGIHAWKDSGSKQYHEYIRNYLNRDNDWTSMAFRGWHGFDEPEIFPRPAMVTGTVFLWGDVVEHERGFRAEFARVRSLDWLYPDAIMMGREVEALDSLRALYGVKPSKN